MSSSATTPTAAGTTTTTTTTRKRRSETIIVTNNNNNTTISNNNSMVDDNNNSSSITVGGQLRSSSNNTTNTNTSKPKLNVRIKRYHGVAQWTWGNAKDEVCGICQSAYEGVAPGCKYPGEDCPVVWGKCSHAFHLQCVLTWLSGSTNSGTTPAQAQNRNTCPICRQEWEFEAKENTLE